MLNNISLHTTARVNAWDYFRALAKALLAPKMNPAANGAVPLIYIDMAATIFMDIWAADRSARVFRAQQYLHSFTNPFFSRGEFMWMPIVTSTVNQYLVAAHREEWALLDKDFSRKVDVTDLVDSDLD